MSRFTDFLVRIDFANIRKISVFDYGYDGRSSNDFEEESEVYNDLQVNLNRNNSNKTRVNNNNNNNNNNYSGSSYSSSFPTNHERSESKKIEIVRMFKSIWNNFALKMWTDFKNTFSHYQKSFDANGDYADTQKEKELWQPLSGFKNVVRGLGVLVASPFMFLNDLKNDWNKSSSVRGLFGNVLSSVGLGIGRVFTSLAYEVRGATQLAATLPTWLAKMPLRAYLTQRHDTEVSKRKIEDAISIHESLQNARREILNEKPDLALLRNIARDVDDNYTRKLQNNRPTDIIHETESQAFRAFVPTQSSSSESEYVQSPSAQTYGNNKKGPSYESNSSMYSSSSSSSSSMPTSPSDKNSIRLAKEFFGLFDKKDRVFALPKVDVNPNASVEFKM